jgi:hypothetical protein
VGDRVYYLLNEEGSFFIFNLYRINIDGTQNTLIQENTEVFRLFSANGILFAAIETERIDSVNPCIAAILSPDGHVEKVIGNGLNGHNVGFGMERVPNTDMLMVMDYIYFRVDGQVQGVYCTATGALFSLSVTEQ